MPKRRKIPKGVRFDVMNRDNFMCRYCGARPPDVKLVIDHFVAVANDDSKSQNDPANLVTSCERCNAGKSDKIVEEQAIPAITEEAEQALRDSLARQDRMLALYYEHDRRKHDIAWEMTKVWADAYLADRVDNGDGTCYFKDAIEPFPKKSTFISMVDKYGMEAVAEAIRRGAVVAAGPYFNGDATRYTWGVLKNMRLERLEREE